MRVRIGRRGIIATLAGLWFLAAGSAATAQNLVVNGDFARGGDPPPGWAKEPEAARKGQVRVAGGVLELAPNAANTTPSAKPLGVGQAIDAASLAGRSLAVSVRLGLSAPATAAIVGLHALRADGAEIGRVQLRRTRPGPGLETFSEELVLPPGEVPKRLILYAVAEGLGGLAQFGAITVTAGQRPAAAGGGAAYAARVSVDAAAQGRAIPRALYGVNIEWWRNANGLWDEKANRLDPAPLALAAALRPSLIRFPGGFLGDHYDWRPATGPRGSRPAIPENPGEGRKVPPHFGTDELIEFANATGADLLLSANLGTGTARMAADWVRYLKDAQRRNPAGPRVQFWEMGNELYGKGEGPAVTLTPEAYVGKLRAFVPAMRAADPAIRVGAIGMENYATFPFNAYPRWNETVLKQAGELIDYFAVHNAYAPVGVPDRADPRDVYRALWAAPLMVAENLQTVAGQIRRFAPPGSAERIRIAVTEWAPLFHVSPSSAWVDHSKTLGSALYVADILRVFIQNDRVDAAAFFKLNEPSFLGLMGARQGQWVPNATYYAFQLYTRHFGEKVVRSRSQAPTYDSVKAGIVPAMKAVPLLESVASLSADGETLFVMLINKSIDRRADVSLDVAGFDSAGAVAHLLTGASPDSNTGTELPRVPGIRWARQANVDERARHLDRGAPHEVSFTSAPLAATGRPISYSVPPHSVASLELRRRR
jgi:alpha-N-arabinofuranosidase